MKKALAKLLLDWYRDHARVLPWRENRDPYRVWVSESMLQQTQVKTVIPYYNRWMERFPDVDSLAKADDQDVLALWQGLGYYRRAKLLLQGARFVAETGWPQSRKDWLKVPGVGPYTASAISSISSGEAVAVVDGNVERVFARLTGFAEPRPALARAAWTWAEENVATGDPGTWNQALMELGATVCRPSQPDCKECPLAAGCIARAQNLQSVLPVPKQRTVVKHVRQEAWIHHHRGSVALEQIPGNEWWEGMWRFPQSTATRSEENPAIGLVRHSVTNHSVKLAVHLVLCDEPMEGFRWVSVDATDAVPMPAPQRKALGLALSTIQSARG